MNPDTTRVISEVTPAGIADPMRLNLSRVLGLANWPLQPLLSQLGRLTERIIWAPSDLRGQSPALCAALLDTLKKTVGKSTPSCETLIDVSRRANIVTERVIVRPSVGPKTPKRLPQVSESGVLHDGVQESKVDQATLT